MDHCAFPSCQDLKGRVNIKQLEGELCFHSLEGSGGHCFSFSSSQQRLPLFFPYRLFWLTRLVIPGPLSFPFSGPGVWLCGLGRCSEMLLWHAYELALLQKGWIVNCGSNTLSGVSFPSTWTLSEEWGIKSWPFWFPPVFETTVKLLQKCEVLANTPAYSGDVAIIQAPIHWHSPSYKCCSTWCLIQTTVPFINEEQRLRQKKSLV